MRSLLKNECALSLKRNNTYIVAVIDIAFVNILLLLVLSMLSKVLLEVVKCGWLDPLSTDFTLK